MRRIEAERLIKQAERDLENARKTIGIGAYELAAFVAQQAVEKYLKAAWMVLKEEPPPRTHSLTELGDALGVPRDRRRQLVYCATVHCAHGHAHFAFAASAASAAGAINGQARPIRRIEQRRACGRMCDEVVWQKGDLKLHSSLDCYAAKV